MPTAMPDFSPYFARYEVLVAQSDALFARIQAEFPSEVVCRERCSSCCHALFDLSLVEALYLNHKFQELVPFGQERSALLDKADYIDRATAKLKKGFYKDSKAGVDSNTILHKAAAMEMRCPLLDDNDLCSLYSVRPITCRLYGVPTAIGGKAHTCGKTGFAQGKPYPTVNLDRIQEQLATLSYDLATGIGSAYSELHLVYLPVSFALVTTFDASYLGIGGLPKGDQS